MPMMQHRNILGFLALAARTSPPRLIENRFVIHAINVALINRNSRAETVSPDHCMPDAGL